MEKKNQNIEESSKKDLTQEEIEDVQGGSCHYSKIVREGEMIKCSKCGNEVSFDVGHCPWCS